MNVYSPICNLWYGYEHAPYVDQKFMEHSNQLMETIKKNGADAVCGENGLRNELVEELADVLMYYNNVLLCYDILPEELK